MYREKYALNLKREFPRIRFYADFWQWADCGKELMDLHIDYESVEPWKLNRRDVANEKTSKASLAPKPMLKADKEGGRIVLDSETVLEGIPPEAWDYKLGNRSALEWILDQYKEKKSKDPTIREKFDTYRFTDYKEKVIDLLQRVTRVSVETRKIVEAMQGARRQQKALRCRARLLLEEPGVLVGRQSSKSSLTETFRPVLRKNSIWPGLIALSSLAELRNRFLALLRHFRWYGRSFPALEALAEIYLSRGRTAASSRRPARGYW